MRLPLGIKDHNHNIIQSNARNNHHSALIYADEIDAFFEKELKEGALFGLFHDEPHPAFTWSKLMTSPKELGRRVILDLSYRENSVNMRTIRDTFDDSSFKLTLPTLDICFLLCNVWVHMHEFSKLTSQECTCTRYTFRYEMAWG